MSETRHLQIEALLETALAEAGAEQFRDSVFKGVLARYVDALNHEAVLNVAGHDFHHGRLLGILKTRLGLEQWLAQYPEILEETIEAPIVVVGLPRTGTTLLHRTLATDSQLLAPLWYEVRYPIPLDANFALKDGRIAMAEAEVDAMLAAAPELAAIHPMDAVAPDEEIMLLEQSFMSTVAECYAHIPQFGHWLYVQDQQPGYDYLKRLLQFLQWQKRRAGLTGSRWLLKTPHHLHYPEHLLRTFPGAQVIQCHRHPLAVIPSYASMMYSLTAPFTDTCDKHAIAKHWSDKWHAGLNTTMAYRSQHPEIPYLDLQFDDSVSDPEGTVKTVYDFVGAELTPTALAEVTRWREFNRREQRPEHHYSLEEYGFTEAAISEQFANYIDCHIRT